MILRHRLAIGVVVLAAVLRLWGIGFGLPETFHADEPVVVHHALAFGTGDLNPHFFNIPPLTSYLLFVVYGIYYLAGNAAGLFRGTAGFETLFYQDPTSFYLLGRILLGVLPAVLTVIVLYRWISRDHGRSAGLAGMLLLAVNFLHVRDAHYIYPDMLLVLGMVLWFSFILNPFNNPGPGRDWIAGIGTGILAALKYNGVFVLTGWAAWQMTEERGRRGGAAALIRVGTGAAAGFVLANPYSVLDFTVFWQEISEQGRAHSGTPGLHHLTYSLAGAFGWPALALGLVFFAVFLYGGFTRKASGCRSCFSVCIFMLAYYGVLVWKGQAYARYALPLIPFLCYLVGAGLARTGIYGKRPWTVLLIFVLCVWPAWKSAAWDSLMSAPDTRTRAREWIEDHIPPGSRIALDWDFYMPRLNFSANQLTEKIDGEQGPSRRRLEFLLNRDGHAGYEKYFLVKDASDAPGFSMASPVIPFSAAELKRLGIQYVIRTYAGRDSEPQVFYKWLESSGTRIQVWSPYRDGSLHPKDRQPLTGGPFSAAEIFSRVSGGPALELVQIDKTNAER